MTEIEGIISNNTEIKLMHSADEMTLLLNGYKNSLKARLPHWNPHFTWEHL